MSRSAPVTPEHERLAARYHELTRMVHVVQTDSNARTAELNAHRRELILRMVADGVSVAKVAATLGVNRKTVDRLLAGYGASGNQQTRREQRQPAEPAST